MGGKEKKTITFEGTIDPERVVEYLEHLTAGMKAGSVFLQRGGEYLSLHPDQAVNLELEARQSPNKESLTVKLRWRRENETILEEGDMLEIRAGDQPDKE